MKMRKILQKVQDFLDADSRSQQQQMDSISEVLEKLKEKEKKLQNELAQALGTEEKNKLERKIAVCHAQRKKGLAILKQLRTLPPE
ncbi:MAG: hypothetical protein ABJ013_06625 [Halioglobus sp.]